MSRNNNNKNNNRQQQQYSPTNNPSQGDSFFEQQYQYQQYQYGAPAPASTVYRHHRIASNTSSLGNDDIVNTNDGTESANLVERGYYNNNNMKSNNPRVRAAPRPQSPLKQQGQPPSRSGTNNTPPNNPRQSSFRRNMREYNANSSTASSSRASFVTFQQNPATVQQPQQQQQQQDEEYYWMRTQKNNSPPRNTRAAAAAAAVTASSTPLLTPSMEVDENENDYEDQDEERISISSRTSSRSGTKEWLYNWKQFAPSPVKHATQFVRWIVVGGSRYTEPQSDKELHQSLAGLARCLHLLRQYLSHYGMPERGGHPDQNHVLREIIRDLYAGGAPLWALEPVMQKAAEGLTGHSDVNWQLYPRKALIYNPSAGTTMFKIERGFNISKMSAMEGVAVRLASFASNANGVANIPARFPNPQEYKRAQRRGSVRDVSYIPEKSVLARKILNLASKQQGLFYFVNSREYLGGKLEPIEDSIKQKQRKRVDNDNHDDDDDDDDIEAFAPPDYDIEDFWIVSDEERELFSRLACLEALKAIAQIDERNNDPERETIYTPLLILICRVTASAGACAFWFNGSLQDMIVAGILAVLVAFIGTTSLLNKQERLVYEVVASFFVGITSGLLALRWPNHFCFAALAISGVLDLLQGFRVVYAIIEIMSKHTVAGGADLLEGILFTGLIAYFLQFGKYVAASK